MFLVLLFLASVVSAVVPVLLFKNLSLRWHLPRSIFWKAGFAGLVIGTIVAGVMLNLDSVFPNFQNSSDLLYAVILGVVSGLFSELGKFLMLDRFMPKVRDYHSGVFFGLGWGGLGIMLMGIFFAIGVFGMNTLLTTPDITTVLPNAEPEQLELLKESQQQIQVLVQSPWKGLSPLFENSMIILFDIAMTLIILLGLQKARTRYVWLAVLLRSAMATSVVYILQTKLIPVEIVFIVWALAAAGLIFTLQKNLAHSAPNISKKSI